MRNLVFLAQFCTSQMWLTACETSLGRETGLLSSRDAPNATHGDDREIRIAYIQLLGRHPESTKTEMTTIVLSTNRPQSANAIAAIAMVYSWLLGQYPVSAKRARRITGLVFCPPEQPTRGATSLASDNAALTAVPCRKEKQT